MTSPAPLPFKITADIAERGAVRFTASIEGQSVAAEKYVPGDGDKRRRVAKVWADDPRLSNGSPTDTGDIAHELERVELEALVQVNAIREEPAEVVPVREAASYVDGRFIAELAWNRKQGRTDFIVLDRDDGGISRSERIETAAGHVVPPSICGGIVTPGDLDGSVLLPDDHDPAGTDEARLRGDIAAFINRYVELPGDAITIATEYVLLTWVFDGFDELPYLAFRTADLGRGKSRALETVGVLCYRPLIVGGGSSAAAVLRMLDVFGGTLVADEFDHAHNTELSADLNRILNQGFQRRRPLVKCDGENNQPRPFRCYGPKLFALRQRLGDDATESRTISIRMQQRTRADIPLSLPRARFDAEALALRNRLLAYRFANLGRVRINPALADARLEDRLNQIGLPLLSVANDDDTRKRIVAALTAQQGNIAADRAESLAGEVLAAAMELGQPGDVVYPGKVAAKVNERRAAEAGIGVDRLGRRSVSPHRAGKVLADRLELPRIGRDSSGSRIKLDPARLEQLCQRYGVPPGTSTPSTQVHPRTASASENPLFDSANGGNALGALGALPQGVGALSDDDAERRAIQETEAEEEQLAAEQEGAR